MNAISKIAIFVALMAVASPALAQSFDPDTGSGNVSEFNYSPAAVQPPKVAAHQSKAAARQSGLRALARVSGSSGTIPPIPLPLVAAASATIRCYCSTEPAAIEATSKEGWASARPYFFGRCS
jgi:hypothetical protein